MNDYEQKYTSSNKSILEYKIELLDKEIKSNKSMAIIAGSVGTLSAIIALGSIVIGNQLIGVQNVGTTIAMASYFNGYSKQLKQKINEKNELLKETENEQSHSSERIKQVNELIEKYQISKKMNLISGSGFLITTIANVLLYINELDAGIINSSMGSIIFSASITILDILLQQDD